MVQPLRDAPAARVPDVLARILAVKRVEIDTAQKARSLAGQLRPALT